MMDFGKVTGVDAVESALGKPQRPKRGGYRYEKVTDRRWRA